MNTLDPQSNHIDNISTTSRKSSLSLAKPIPFPDDYKSTNAHKIDIMFIPSNEHANDVALSDVQLRQNDCDGQIKTVL